MALTKLTANVNNIQALSDLPNSTDGLTSAELKERFDKAGADIKSYLNTILTEEVDALATTINSRITEVDNKIPKFSQIYPVGSIYISTSPANPSVVFPGTSWTQLKNSFLFATNATSGEKGTITGTGTNTGAATGNTGSTTLTINQMPKHSHKVRYVGRNANGIYGGMPGTSTNTSAAYNELVVAYEGGGQGHTHTLNSHTHTIPRLEVYVWKRTS